MSVLGFSVPHPEKYWLVSKPRQCDKDKLWYCKSSSFDVSRQAWEQKNTFLFTIYFCTNDISKPNREWSVAGWSLGNLCLLKHIEAFNEPLSTVELPQSLSNSKGIPWRSNPKRREQDYLYLPLCAFTTVCRCCGISRYDKCCQWASLCWNLSVIDLEPVGITIKHHKSNWMICVFVCFFVPLHYITSSMEVAHSKEM